MRSEAFLDVLLKIEMLDEDGDGVRKRWIWRSETSDIAIRLIM